MRPARHSVGAGARLRHWNWVMSLFVCIALIVKEKENGIHTTVEPSSTVEPITWVLRLRRGGL